MVEDEGMDRHVSYDEPVGLAAPDRRRLAADPFLLARKLSGSGGFGAKFSEPDYSTSIERLESSNSLGSTTEVSRTASSGSLTEEANEDVYTLLGTLLQSFSFSIYVDNVQINLKTLASDSVMKRRQSVK
jgi:hypothetical protein